MTWDDIKQAAAIVTSFITVSGGSIWIFKWRTDKLNSLAQTGKIDSEARKVEFDIYDGTIENWKDIVKELRADMIDMKEELRLMQQNYLKKIGELEVQQEENKTLKAEVKELRGKVSNLSMRLSKYESLPKDENNNTIDI
jgi:small-conductance mechanosensitive channel